MKKIFILIAMIAAFNAGAQVVPVLTTTLTPGSGDFLIDKSHYPFDALILNIMSKDTGKVGLNYTMTGGSFIIPKQRVKYVDGRTGLPFVSIGRLKQFYDSFMVSPPFTTTIAGDLNILGDATAAKQDTQITRLTAINNKLPSLGTASVTGSIPVNIASNQTVPISAASLPLPSGAATSANQTTLIARMDSLDKYATNKGVSIVHVDSLDTYEVPDGYIIIGGLRDSSGLILVDNDIDDLSDIEESFLLHGFVLPSIPMQSYRALATAHTITANVSLNVFVLKLN